jgi:hypothetical protein
MIYRLRYDTIGQAVRDLEQKGVTKNIIWLPNPLQDKAGAYDDEGNEITPPTYFEGVHVDVVSDKELHFENEVNPNNPKHVIL